MLCSDCSRYFIRCLSGPTIKVITGQDKETFTVHREALLGVESASLKSLLSDKFLEGTQNIIDWSEFDTPTVKRFFQYLYLRDYEAPLPKLLTLPKIQSRSSARYVRKYTPKIAIPASAFLPETLSPLGTLFKLSTLATQVGTMAGRVEEAQEDGYYDFLDTVLAHTRVYVLAHYHGIDSLKQLALQQLAQIMTMVSKFEETTILQLLTFVRFAYDNTDASKEEPIRKLASQFCAINYTKVMKYGEMFEELVRENEDFAVDLMEKVNLRLAATDGQNAALIEELLTMTIGRSEAERMLREEKKEHMALKADMGRLLQITGGQRSASSTSSASSVNMPALL